MSIANTSHLRQPCDGFVIANRIANASQIIASNRHSVSSSVKSLVETPHHGVQIVTREAFAASPVKSADGMMR